MFVNTRMKTKLVAIFVSKCFTINVKKVTFFRNNKYILVKNVILTSFQVIDRKNDWKFIYVGNLAQNILSDSQIYQNI